MSRKIATCISLLVFFAFASAASAEIRPGTWSVSPFLGGYLFEGPQNLDLAPVFGLRAGYHFTPRLAAEGVLEFIPTSFDEGSGDVDAFGYRIEGLYHFMPESRLVPYLAVGAGGIAISRPAGFDDTRNFAVDWGAGVKYFLTDALALRGDLRHIIYDERPEPNLTHNLEATAGISFIFGGAKAAPAPAPAPRKAEAAPPPPPPPTVSLSADPPSVDPGKCATLTWSSENATEASIDQGIGGVKPSGSREVCPGATTLYTISANGPGGARTAKATVTVNPPPPPPPPAAKVIDRLTLHINFDTDKAVIRNTDVPELSKAIAFVKKYPGSKISVEGYTDSRGGDSYNLKLSERRAHAVKKYLEDKGGVKADLISAVGKGKANPVGDNATEKGRFENRRVEVLVIGD